MQLRVWLLVMLRSDNLAVQLQINHVQVRASGSQAEAAVPETLKTEDDTRKLTGFKEGHQTREKPRPAHP